MQAKMEHARKGAKFHSASLKYWNREAGAKRRVGGLTRGLSRTKSDAYSKALWALGKGRLAQEGITKAKAKLSRYSDRSGVGVSNRYNVAKYKALLDKQKQIEQLLKVRFQVLQILHLDVYSEPDVLSPLMIAKKELQKWV